MENEKTIVIDGVIYSEDKKVLIKYPKNKKEEISFNRTLNGFAF